MNVELCEVAEADFESLSRFVALIFNREPSLVRSWFEFWWRLNPLWNETIPRGWLVRSHNREIIAFTSNIPLPYMIGGQRGVCYATGAVGVHPDWRGRGIAKLVARSFSEQKTPDLLVGCESGPEAFRLWQSVGMTSMPLAWPDFCPRVIASHQNWIKAGALQHRVPSLIANGISVCGRLMDKRKADPSGVVQQTSPFEPADLEQLLRCRASGASTYPFRDVTTLNWLYFSSPQVRKNRLVFVARNAGRLVGFAAYKILDKSLLLLECRCVSADSAIAADLLAISRDQWRQLGGTWLLIWPYTPMVETALPSAKKAMRKPMTYVYKANTDVLVKQDWERTPGDGDISLY
jgi:GNAT superfamily N-acetyltransferase